MPTLLLLPGMDGTGMLFDAFVEALSSDCRTIIVAYPASEPLDYAALESIVRRQLPDDQPYVLLAESFSGPIAIALAASHPPGLIGVVLCCSFARNPHPAFAVLRTFVPLVPVKQLSGACGALLWGRYGSARLHRKLQHALAGVSVSALVARMRAVLGVDASAMLSEISVPVLYLRATADKVIPRGAGELICRLARNACVVQVEGPHFLLQAAPTDAARVVERFIGRLPAAYANGT